MVLFDHIVKPESRYIPRVTVSVAPAVCKTALVTEFYALKPSFSPHQMSFSVFRQKNPPESLNKQQTGRKEKTAERE